MNMVTESFRLVNTSDLINCYRDDCFVEHS